MRNVAVGLVCCILMLSGCTGKREAVRAAQPHLESFSKLRLRALELLELRADIERKRLLLHAVENPEDPVPDNLQPVLEQMRSQNVDLEAEDIEHGEQLFAQMLQTAFLDDPEVLQAEIVFVEGNGEVSRFPHPEDSELPAGVQWYGLRQQRTFAGLARCLGDDGSEPCVLIQLRSREYPGSAGLTVAFRRP
jgi:hypothetical protein